MQVFRTEIISRRLPKSATLPLMAAALTTVASIMAVAAAATHPEVSLSLLQRSIDKIILFMLSSS